MRSNVHLFLYAVDKEGGCSIMQEKPMSKAKWIVAVMLVIMTGVAAYTILVQACLGVATFWSIVQVFTPILLAHWASKWVE